MYPKLAPEVAYRAAKDGAVLLDVRAPEEFEDGHPDGAVNIPLTVFVEGRLTEVSTFVASVRARIPSDAKLLLLCRSGARAEHAAHLLSEAGFVGASIVEGGFEGTRGPFGEVILPGWRRAKLP